MATLVGLIFTTSVADLFHFIRGLDPGFKKKKFGSGSFDRNTNPDPALLLIRIRNTVHYPIISSRMRRTSRREEEPATRPAWC